MKIVHVAFLMAAAALAWSAVPATSGESAWQPSVEKGIDAAKKSGRPVFLVTIWKTGVCGSCDTWRDQVQKNADVAKIVARFEPVEALYDGLNGKIIPWTLANGGTSTDPSAQLFVVGLDGKVISRLDDAKAHTPSSVVEWLTDLADRWEKDHPATALAFSRAAVTVVVDKPEGATAEVRTPTCAAADEAREAKRPVLLYFGRDSAAADDKAHAAEAASSRKLERGALDSKAAADVSSGWALLRFDVSDADHAAYAKALGVDKFPALLVWEPGAEKPSRLAPTITGPDLAFRLKKFAAPK
ncbi:MAG: hypothetical protein K8T90_11175 [Planctomycetes bacterium]|nr:hypothetical protein [Planctomycetota bacterium]